MSKIFVVCAVVFLASLNWTSALPVKDQDVEDLMYKLQQLKQLNDGKLNIFHNMQRSHIAYHKCTSL